VSNVSDISVPRLTRRTVPAALLSPAPTAPGGIVHLGLGNFHRAHQAVYTARALALEPGPWRIRAFSHRSRHVVDSMREQDNLYSVLEISPEGANSSVPDVHAQVDVAADNPHLAIDAIAAPTTRIVTLTITEAGYHSSHITEDLDLIRDAVQQDLARTRPPRTAIGQIAEGLTQRFLHDEGPLTVVSCDNMRSNGDLVKRLVRTFVSTGSPPVPADELLSWMDGQVAFPCSMVDRIVPATTASHQHQAAQLLGAQDLVPVPAEPFSMWVMQERFAAGRPAWDRAGVIFSDDVVGYELMKLRLLNGCHSLIAYLGVLADAPTIPDAIRLPHVEEASRTLMRQEMLPTVRVPDGVDIESHMENLFVRWSNTALGHSTAQVASDGSQKLPQRLGEAALAHRANGVMPHAICLTVAAFLACLAPRTGNPSHLANDIKDPLRPRVTALAAEASTPLELVNLVLDRTGLLSRELVEDVAFRERIGTLLAVLQDRGTEAAVAEATR